MNTLDPVAILLKAPGITTLAAVEGDLYVPAPGDIRSRRLQGVLFCAALRRQYTVDAVGNDLVFARLHLSGGDAYRRKSRFAWRITSGAKRKGYPGFVPSQFLGHLFTGEMEFGGVPGDDQGRTVIVQALRFTDGCFYRVDGSQFFSHSVEIGKPFGPLGFVVKGHPGFDRGQGADHFFPTYLIVAARAMMRGAGLPGRL